MNVNEMKKKKRNKANAYQFCNFFDSAIKELG